MMPFLCVLIPDPDDPLNTPRRRRTDDVQVGLGSRRWLVAGVMVALTLALVVAMLGRAPMLIVTLMLLGVPTVMIVLLALLLRGMGVFRAEDVKEKRRLHGADMYTLIDRLVDDLDEDEAAYLRRRLDEREAGLRIDLQSLLDQRESDRRSGQR